MNNQLKKHIDEMKKKGLDDEALLDIASFHKHEVPLKEKNWQELTDYLNCGLSGEQLRSRLKSFEAKSGDLPIKDIEGNTQASIESDQDTIRTLQKERIKTRDAVNSYKRFMREDARMEVFVDTIKEVAGNINLPKVKYKKDVKTGNTEAVLLFSDLHIGVNCNNFYNTYNIDVAVARVEKLISETIKYCKLHKVKRLTVCNLGDLIHGIIHIDSRIEQATDAVSQVIKAANITAQLLNELQQAAPELIYRSCSDNHSRLVANKAENISKENFGRLIDFYLEEALKNTKVKFINDNLDYGLGRFELMNGKTCMFAHGHEDNVNQVVQNYMGATKKFVDYIFLGHLHNSKLKSFNGSKVIVNGSIVGTEQYALSKRLFGRAEQTLLVFDGDNMISHIIDLQETDKVDNGKKTRK